MQREEFQSVADTEQTESGILFQAINIGSNHHCPLGSHGVEPIQLLAYFSSVC